MIFVDNNDATHRPFEHSLFLFVLFARSRKKFFVSPSVRIENFFVSIVEAAAKCF